MFTGEPPLPKVDQVMLCGVESSQSTYKIRISQMRMRGGKINVIGGVSVSALIGRGRRGHDVHERVIEIAGVRRQWGGPTGIDT